MKPRNPMWAMTSKCGEKLLAKAASLIMMFKPSLKQTSVNHCMMVEKKRVIWRGCHIAQCSINYYDCESKAKE